jgi:tRNA wybutosine-synthesizing protein 3
MKIEIDKRIWERIRERHLAELERAYENGLVDLEINPLLEAINNYSKDCITTSSCYGRIVLIASRHIGDKSYSSFYRKWHHPIDKEDLWREIINYRGKRTLWLLLQSSIIHVKCRTLELAIEMRNMGIEAGYKFSKILSISTTGFTTEISGTERLNLPVNKGGEILIDRKFIDYFPKITNEMFQRIEIKKNRLIEILKKKNLKIRKNK